MAWPESPPPAVIPVGAARPLARTSSAISRAMDRKSRLCLAVRASGVWRLSALELPAATFSATKARATNKINETNFPTSHPLGPGARPGYFRLVPKPRPRASEDREPRGRETLISRAPHRGGPVGLSLTNIPEGIRYTKDHEWAKPEGKRVRVGITDHAQTELTDVVYVELPPEGKVVTQGEPIGTVESMQAVSEIFAPVSGKVVEVNKILGDQPELVNKDPYGSGWMAILEVSNPADLNALLDAATYRRLIGE